MIIKERYIAPQIRIIPLITETNIAADFIISSKSVGEDDALSKGGYFNEENEEETNPNPWDESQF